jgi:diguanylate cyclase (GGDEF)-like protein
VGRQACNKIAELYLDDMDPDKAKSFLELSAKYKEFVNTPSLDIVYRYLSVVMAKTNDKASLLIKLAKEYDSLDNNEIKWKIYKSIGTDLADSGDSFGGLKNLITSFNHLRLLMENVPKEYKIQFLKSHNRISIKEKLTEVAQKITGQSGIVQSNVTISEKISDIEHEISEYFDYKSFKELIIRNEDAVNKKSADLNESMLGKFLLDLFDRINGFGIDIEDNIKKMVEAFMGFTQAKNGFLAISDENNEIQMLYADIKTENMGFYKYIIEKVRQGEESIMIPDVFEYKKKVYGSLIPKDISAVFCIPIVSADDVGFLEIERRKGSGAKNIKGYLYLDTDSIINNFSDETGNLCKKVSKIAYILIDNYNLKMVNAFDKLTKLYTRKYFESALANAIAKGGVFSIIMADIDRFKAVNDKYGHQVGDEVLAKLSDIILKNLRKTDICARYGGEEFVMLLPDTDTQGTLQLAEKIRKKIETAGLFSHHSPVTISMGIATYPMHSTWSKDLIDKADQAMYFSKEAGRNKTKIYDENLVKSDRRVNKLAGIVEGNVEEDINRVENIIEVLDIQRNMKKTKEDKVFEFLGKSIKVSAARIGSVFFINDHNEPIRQITRRGTVPATIKSMDYNRSLLERCIQNKTGEYLIDWSKSVSVDAITGMPDWQSVIIIPITNYEKVNAVLYLSVSLKEKEFEADTYNYIDTLCKIIAPVFL